MTFQLPGPECNRTGTGNKFNLIMRMTVSGALAQYSSCSGTSCRATNYQTRGRVVSNVFELVAQPHFHVYELGNKICLNYQTRALA